MPIRNLAHPNHSYEHDCHANDIAEAFLNSPIQEEVYVRNIHATSTRVWHLLYGTKRAAHNWNRVLDDNLKGVGFVQCPDGPGLYYRISDQRIIVDILCAFKNRDVERDWVRYVARHVTLGEGGQFLCMGVDWTFKGASISRR